MFWHPGALKRQRFDLSQQLNDYISSTEVTKKIDSLPKLQIAFLFNCFSSEREILNEEDWYL